MVYILTDTGINTEPEFGIDEPIVFSIDDHPEMNIELLEIFEGLYTYVAIPGELEYAPGEFIDYDGYVVVDGNLVE